MGFYIVKQNMEKKVWRERKRKREIISMSKNSNM